MFLEFKTYFDLCVPVFPSKKLVELKIKALNERLVF